MEKIVEKKLSYKLVGLFFEIQNELGRFCREKQYGDALEAKLKKDEYLKHRRNFNSETDSELQIKSKFLNICRFEKKFVASHRSNKGQLLVESMVGIGIVLVGLLGILGLISSSASINRVISQQLIANYLASEGIEITKNLLDADWMKDGVWNDTYITSNGSFEVDYKSANLMSNLNRKLLLNPGTNLYSYQSGAPSPFTRTINIEFISPDEVRVNSIVAWNTRGGNFSVNLEDHFFNWR